METLVSRNARKGTGCSGSRVLSNMNVSMFCVWMLK